MSGLIKNPNQPVDPRETRNLLLAVVLSVAVVFFWQSFVDKPKPPAPATAVEAAQNNPALPPVAGSEVLPTPAAKPVDEVADLPRLRTIVLAETPRLKIDAPRVHGSINLQGGRIDDLTLASYRETVDPASKEITLLSPSGTSDAYYADFGWRGDVAMPDSKTVWTVASGSVLTPDAPVVLTWNNGHGLTFSRKIEIDANYMFTITDSVTNENGASVTLHPYGLLARNASSDPSLLGILHEGPIGVLDNKLMESTYQALIDDGQHTASSKGGWLGITDKYWLVAMVPDQTAQLDVRFLHAKQVSERRFQTDFISPAVVLEKGQTHSMTNHLFAGAKEVEVLDKYETEMSIPRFDRAIDFGWFYFLTKPFFYALNWIASVAGSLGVASTFGVAIIIFTVIIRVLLFPLANKSYIAMTRMKAMNPRIKEIREAYANDSQKQSQEIMALYKKEKLNPAAGCLPMLLQIPIFFALYKVLYVSIEMRHAPFFGWLTDLSAQDPSSLLTLFGLVPWPVPSMLQIGILPILMGITMWLQMKMNPPPTDPSQKIIFGLMPWVFTYMMAHFPAGLIIYWTWSNILSIAQQYVIMRRMHVHVFDDN